MAVIVALVVFAYVSSYVWRSVRGRYEPAVIGVNGVKCYHWAPRGFVEEFRWNRNLIAAYCPLYLVDMRLWHTSEDAEEGRYPVNEVAAEEIGKVYRAWNR